MPFLASLCGGALCGFLLSASRAPDGLDLAGLAGATGADMAAFRAAALLAIALGMWSAPRRALGAWLVGTALGYALHGLVLFHALWVDGWPVEVLLLAITAAALALRFSKRDEPAEPLHLLTRTGLVLGAAGVALALESLARPLRLFGRGLPSDDTVFGIAFLATIALGALAFGPLVVRAARVALPLGLAAAAATAHDGLGFLEKTGANQAFEGYVRSFRLAPTDWGGLACDALLAGRAFVLPGFLLGAALACVQKGRELTALLVGAALGTLAMPALVRVTTAIDMDGIARAPSVRVALCTALAVVGALLVLCAPAAPGERAIGRLARGASAAAALGIALAIWLAPVRRTLAYRPFEIMPMAPSWAGEVEAGVLTLGIWPRDGLRLALDARPLTPGAAGFVDEDRALSSIPVLPRLGGRVLLVGQLTPQRAQVLVAAGAREIDRTGAWSARMPAIEQQLFGELARPPGAVLSPSAARAKLAQYDLVVAPPVAGVAPATRAARAHATAIAWTRADAPLAGRPLGTGVLLAGNDFKNLAVGFGGAAATADAPFPAGRARRWTRTPLAELMRPRAAAGMHLVETTARLAAAARGTPRERIAAALELLARAQRPSAAWDTDAEATELDPAALALLRDTLLAAPAPPPEPERSLAEYLARVCVGKRDVESLYTYFEPLAAARGPWLALERALLAADVESLDFEGALARLSVLLPEPATDITLLRLRAASHLQLGDPARAAADLRAACAVATPTRDLERELAMALIRARDPEGLDLAEELLRANPDDKEMAQYLDAARGAAPMPRLPDPPRALSLR